MRSYCTAVLLLATVFLAAVNAAPESATAKVNPAKSPSHLRSIATNGRYVPPSRLLRSAELPADEERAMKLRLVRWLNRSQQTKISTVDTKQVKKWVKKDDSMASVFNRLELNAGIEQALANPKLRTYAAYIDQLNKKNPSKEVSMVEMFAKTYGDEAVAKALEAAAISRSTKKIASRLRTDLLDTWSLQGKSVDDVFTMLSLDKAGSDLFVTPQFKTWVRYTKMAMHTPEHYMLSALKAKYGYDGLSKIFLAAPRAGEMGTIALNLENKMVNTWLSQIKTPKMILKLLKLDEGVDKLLMNPNVKMLSGYLHLFNSKYPDQQRTLVGVFTEFYGVKAVSNMLEAAKKVPETKGIATQWHAEMLKGTKIQ
ncbi:hypothetical protein PHYSODRAFT_286258 [Phytophthora sojae]|uniref:RxLR effector protein n=2 Tax=Phytophthora sojae TaxID=67593 RepID=G4ZQC2_PHYSP|nr:hypothetical protein PHYSODRAFT_286258 [Phytophthora sojae]AEK80761.1 Avh151 [Phytophthora sojae]AEK80762.1 Avh151 [Phytophthora sojae]EGZ15157.1 hypothetical protein PHYSODRAFT_286258 [Phytophthora sojae]|eukprot:XP_009528906.1 hypothetical protein PHYSODRAFT_286258 [Phytophthora sojae]